MPRYASTVVCLLGAVRAAGQTCPSQVLLDSGTTELTPTPAAALEVFDFDGPGPQPARLVALGAFNRAGQVSVRGLAVWDGAAWAAVPGTPPDLGWRMQAFNDPRGPALYIAGITAVLHRFD